MRTALTVITTAILTAIAFLVAWQNGLLGNIGTLPASCPTPTEVAGDCLAVTDGDSCTTPRGATIPHGDAVLSFENDTVEGDATCISRTSICNDGTWLDDTVPHANQNCTIEGDIVAMQDCAVGNILVPHDSTNTFYRESKTGDGSYVYVSQQRYCFDGEMDGDASYTKLNLISSCTIQVGEAEVGDDAEEDTPSTTPAPAPTTTTTTTTTQQASNVPDALKYARCTGPFGDIWQHGKSSGVYLQPTVPYGQTCQAVSVVCGYGALRFGTPDNIGNPVQQDMFGECIVGDPVGCSTACGDIDHGASVTTYGSATLPYGSAESCADIKVESTCNNGSLSPQGGNACSCEVEPPASCTAPNGQIVGHDGALTLYQYPEVQAVAGDGSDTCIRQWRQCKNGTFHDYNGNPAGFTFEYPTCTVLPPPDGSGEGGEGVPQE